MKSEGTLPFSQSSASFLIASFDTRELSPKSTLLLRMHPCLDPNFMWGWGSGLVPYLSCAKVLLLSPHSSESQGLQVPKAAGSPFLSVLTLPVL